MIKEKRTKTEFERWLNRATDPEHAGPARFPGQDEYRERHRPHKDWSYGLWLRQNHLDVFNQLYRGWKA